MTTSNPADPAVAVRARGRYAKGTDKRREIIEAATAAVVELGYLKVSLREVARRVGLSQAGLLHHFPTKEELFVEVLALRDQRGEAAETADILGNVVAAFAQTTDSRGLMHLYTVLAAEAVDDRHAAHRFFTDRYQRLIARFAHGISLQQAAGTIAPDLDGKAVATILVAAMDGLQMQYLVDPGSDPAAVFDYLWQLLRTVPATPG